MPSSDSRLLVPGDASEVARFWAKVVRGPESACWIWVGAIADDGYGRFWIRRGDRELMVRPNRYALALTLGGLPADVHALHNCDVPICCRVAERHIHEGDRADNMREMVERGRSLGGTSLRQHKGMRRSELRSRSRALRAAVVDGWREDLIAEALARSGEQPLF